jgi:DNA polymerase III delta subunit
VAPTPGRNRTTTDAAAVLAEIRAGEAKPVYLIHGTEEYLVEATAEKIVRALAGTGPDAAEVIRPAGDTVDWGGLIGRLRTPSLFEPKLVFLLPRTDILAPGKGDPGTAGPPASDAATAGENDDAGSPPRPAPPGDDTALLRDAIESGFGTAHVLVLTAAEVDRRRSLFKAIRKAGRVLEFSPQRWQQEKAAGRLVQERLRRAGKNAGRDALARLQWRVGASLRRLAGELDKLILYTGDRPEITAADVDAVVGVSREEQIFDLTAALGAGDYPAAAYSLRQLLQQGEPYMMILGFLRRQFERIVAARDILDGDLGRRWNRSMGFPEFQRKFLPELNRKQEAGEIAAFEGHPYALYKTLQQADPFTAAGAERILREMLEVHRGIVSGSGSPPMLLEDLLDRICRIQTGRRTA